MLVQNFVSIGIYVKIGVEENIVQIKNISTMATIKYKYKVGDVVKRKDSMNEYIIEKIELGYYTLSDVYCPTCLPSHDLSCSTIDNKNVYEFIRHMDKKEYKEIMNRMLCN